MFDRLLRLGLFGLFALLPFSTPALAQDSSWTVRVFSDGGALFHVRNLGKNAVNISEQSALQTIAQFKTSPVIAGGVEVGHPGGGFRFLGRVSSTVGATARGLLVICQTGNVAAPGEGFCAIEEEVDASIVDASAEMIFKKTVEGRRINPVFSVGLGMRKHDFEQDPTACSPYTGDLEEVCRRSRELFDNPSTNPLLTFGAGLETDQRRLTGFVHTRVVISSYTGGSGISDGETAIDLAVTGGLSFRVW